MSTSFLLAVLPVNVPAVDTSPMPLDKRVTGERNRTDVLSWLGRSGWLPSRMVAALVWPDTASTHEIAGERCPGRVIKDKQAGDLVIADVARCIGLAC